MDDFDISLSNLISNGNLSQSFGNQQMANINKCRYHLNLHYNCLECLAANNMVQHQAQHYNSLYSPKNVIGTALSMLNESNPKPPINKLLLLLE